MPHTRAVRTIGRYTETMDKTIVQAQLAVSAPRLSGTRMSIGEYHVALSILQYSGYIVTEQQMRGEGTFVVDCYGAT